MFLAYDGIVFDVLLLNGWEQTPVMSDDGADFLYWHHIIDITCVVNPHITSQLVMPTKKNEVSSIDRIMKNRVKRNEEEEQYRNSRLRSKGMVSPVKPTPRTDIDSNGEPIKTPIPVPGPNKVSPTSVSDPGGKTNFFFDTYGGISQSADPNAINYPLKAYAGQGIPYATDLAVKTGPVSDPTLSNWVDSTIELLVAPATVKGTSVEFSSNPESQLDTASTPKPIPIPIDIDGKPQSSYNTDPLAKQRRVYFPGDANLPASDTELRDRLQVPRRKLKVWLNTGLNGSPEFILNLPYDGCTTDANVGPKCVDANMTAIHGNISGVKRLVFECFEALPLFYGQKKGDTRVKGAGLLISAAGIVALPQRPSKLEILTPPLISNRWSMRQVPDPVTHLNNIVIAGKAIFRMDVLSRMKLTPDQLRPYIMPPIALGYIRKPPEVSIGSLGNEIEYTIIDEQQMMNNPGGLRWGVHSVVTTQSCFSNNPIEATIALPTESKMSGRSK